MFELPKLKYNYNELEPHIDAQTMEIHHTKHHAGYTKKLNAAIEQEESLQNKTIEEILSDLNSVPESVRTTVRNNGGGYYNHMLFFSALTPNYKEPSESLMRLINESFENFESMKEQLANKSVSQFGSGWGWLVQNNEGKLEILSTANQDNPISSGYNVLFGIDVWEHAYYLNYQNKRNEYVEAIFNVIDWEVVESRVNS